MKNKEKTLIDFADELLRIWGRDFIESEKYRECGMTYIEAMSLVYQWNKGAEKNIETLKQFYKLLGLAIEYLNKKVDKCAYDIIGGEKHEDDENENDEGGEE